MKMTSCKFTNKKYLQIYLTQEELEKQEIKELINKYKKEKYSVAIFVNGNNNYTEILNKIIKKQVELNNN